VSRRGQLSPLHAYEVAERQKQRLGAAFRAKLIRLHRIMSENGAAAHRIPPGLPETLRQSWHDAVRRFAATPATDRSAIVATYRDVVMQFGLKRIEPASRSFGQDLREFHRNYVTNFPLPEEQESLEGFRDLWRASPRDGGYEEIGYSALCPLTGRYIMGVNFTVQPRSNSVHFIYGFVNPIARGLSGFSASIVNLMRDVSQRSIASHFERCPADRPSFYSNAGPLILFEKNIIDEMSLTEILMDTAHVDIDRPPRRGARLAASSISQNMRDFIWDRRGGRVIDYNSIQSSLDGVVRVPTGERDTIIAWLNRMPLDHGQQRRAEAILRRCLDGRLPGCRTLNLCAFVEPGTRSVPSAQIEKSNAIFQGISVVKDPEHLQEDIYFQAQMASLAEHTRDGAVALRPITPSGPGVLDFHDAERLTKRLLAAVTWPELRDGRDRTYSEWLRLKAPAMAEATA
jgi:hypothetical protein